MKRVCQNCGEPFEVREGSLVRLCRREICRDARRIRRKQDEAQALRERARIEEIRRDITLRSMWPEFEEMLLCAARLGDAPENPGRPEVAAACKAVAQAKGAVETRLALVELAAVALRWGACLPRQSNPDAKEAETKRKRRDKADSVIEKHLRAA